jgi:hypothetical protein
MMNSVVPGFGEFSAELYSFRIRDFLERIVDPSFGLQHSFKSTLNIQLAFL